MEFRTRKTITPNMEEPVTVYSFEVWDPREDAYSPSGLRAPLRVLRGSVRPGLLPARPKRLTRQRWTLKGGTILPRREFDQPVLEAPKVCRSFAHDMTVMPAGMAACIRSALIVRGLHIRPCFRRSADHRLQFDGYLS